MSIRHNNARSTILASQLCVIEGVRLRYLLQSCLILCLGLIWFSESVAGLRKPLCLNEGGKHYCVDANREWDIIKLNVGIGNGEAFWNCFDARKKWKETSFEGLTYAQKLIKSKEFIRSCAEEYLPSERYGDREGCSEVKETELPWEYVRNRFNRGIPSLQRKTFELERKAFDWVVRDRGENSPCGAASFAAEGRISQTLKLTCPNGYMLHYTRPICHLPIRLEEENPVSCEPHSPNPVLMQTGEKRLYEEDYPGTAFGGLRFRRTYRAHGNPVLYDYSELLPLERVESSLGENWQHNYSQRLYISNSEKGIHVLYRGGEGGLLSFNESGEIPYKTDGLSDQRLKKKGSIWRYERGDGYYEEYDQTGRLLRRHWKDARGTETLAYSGDLLSSVTDSSGRKLEFSYNTKGQLVGLMHPGGVVRYQYREFERPKESHLEMVENADGSHRRYHYEYARKLTGYSDRGRGETKWTRRGRYSYRNVSGINGLQVLSTEHEGADDKLTFGYRRHDSGRRIGSFYRVNENKVNRRWTASFNFSSDALFDSYPLRKTLVTGRSPRSYQYNEDNGRLKNIRMWDKDLFINIGNFEYDEDSGLELVREEGDDESKVYRRTSTRWSGRWILPVEVTRGERLRDSKKVTELLRENYRYDHSGRLLEYSEQDISNSKKRVMRYGYDRGGRMLWEDGYREDVKDIIRYEYDRRGHHTKSTNALGHITTYGSHDIHGNVTRARDANGLVMSYRYDKRGRLLNTQVGDWKISYERDQDGRVTRLSLADGSILEYRYNTGGKLVEVKDSEGNRITYKRDVFDNVLEERWYDEEGEERRRFDRGYTYSFPDEIWERDGVGRWVRDLIKREQWIREDGSVDERRDDELFLENVSWQKREERRWKYMDQEMEIEDVHGGEAEISYDLLDNINSIVDPIDVKTRYGVDAFGYRLWEENVATGRTSYEVDSAGNRTSMRSSDGSVTSYSYDALDRLLIKNDVGEETDVSYTWDTCHIGSLCEVTDGGGEWAYSYTVHGLESSRSYQPAGVNWKIETSRDWHQGRIIQETLPSGRILKYRYHKNGQLRKIVSQRGEYRKILLSHISWLPFGDVQGYRHNNGVSEVWKYDKSYRLLEQKSELHHFEYEWTKLGGILSRQQYAYTLANGVLRGRGEYEYHGDNRGRLENEYLQRGEDYVGHRYQYDANGNRNRYNFTPLLREEDQSKWDWDEKELSYNDRAQLVSVGDDEVGYQYDALGRRSALLAYTEEGSEYTKYKYEYGSDRRLRRIVEPVQTETEGEADAASAADRVVAEYEYDYRGLRVKKTIGKQVRYFNYDDQGRLWSEHRPDGTVVREYVWLGYRPVHMVSYSKEGRVRGRYAIHVDHLGTPRMLTDKESRVVWLWESDAFGNGAANEDVDGDGRTVKFPLRFPGQYYDKETGLHYNWHRYYDPTIGRYITSDPIGLGGGMNTYSYALQNPLLWIDPLGLTVSCTYEQKSGLFRCIDDDTSQETVYEKCYSGAPGAVNDPSQQDIPFVGTIPRGGYDIGTGVDDRGTGPQSLPLTPAADNNQFPSTRDPNTFLIHGDNSKRDQSASEGCIICSRNTRDIIDAAGGGSLLVR